MPRWWDLGRLDDLPGADRAVLYSLLRRLHRICQGYWALSLLRCIVRLHATDFAFILRTPLEGIVPPAGGTVTLTSLTSTLIRSRPNTTGNIGLAHNGCLNFGSNGIIRSNQQ